MIAPHSNNHWSIDRLAIFAGTLLFTALFPSESRAAEDGVKALFDANQATYYKIQELGPGAKVADINAARNEAFRSARTIDRKERSEKFRRFRSLCTDAVDELAQLMRSSTEKEKELPIEPEKPATKAAPIPKTSVSTSRSRPSSTTGEFKGSGAATAVKFGAPAPKK